MKSEQHTVFELVLINTKLVLDVKMKRLLFSFFFLTNTIYKILSLKAEPYNFMGNYNL